ncbi:sulfotransferase [Candidatus Borrarchaeum sp.]|uniref:sulfotransferase family protein n=1 Tax=Candidatus Borrarchaeum sp. TaxID=2846742 RepID=UPI00257DE6B7|nr:sulfotransferase [Candidatus Borrarchaeum sp.]
MSIKIDTSRELEEIHLSLTRILDERDRLFPKHDPQNTKDVRKILKAYANVLKSIEVPNWEPDNKLIDSAKNLTQKCVFICGFMKSGTTLLLELLDNHPELIVMPGDSNLINWINNTLNTPLEERLTNWDVHWISRLINPTGQKPFWIMGEKVHPYLEFLYYLNYWLEDLPSSDTSPFIAVVLAFYCANPQRATDPKFWVEKNPRNELKVDQILNYFPSARFIHIIRDPRSNMASLKRRCKLHKLNWDVEGYSYAIQKSNKLGFFYQKRLGKSRYHILRYEDLIKNPEIEMKTIANFLGIKIDNNLLYPTVNGLPAKSNTMFKDRQIQGKIFANLSEKWRTELDLSEQKEIYAILYPIAKRLGYDWKLGSISWANYLYYCQARIRYLASRMLK